MNYVNDLAGKTFYVIAFNPRWPKFLVGENITEHLKRRGAQLLEKFDKQVDYLVVGSSRAQGRADILKKAKRFNLTVLDEPKLFELLRFDLTGLKFAFTGGFELGASTLEGGPAALLKNVGAQEAALSEADFLVVGERRAKGKTAVLKQAQQQIEAGHNLQMLDEHNYVTLIATHSNISQQLDFPALVAHLRNVGNVVDPKKVDRAISMLKKEAFELYTDVTADQVAGIVKSQTHSQGYYAPWITQQGQYACYDARMGVCMGQQGGVCKHVLVLLLGLARKGDIGLQQALDWLIQAKSKKPSSDENASATMLLRYKGVEAGEVDWRPTETVPEDFYLF